jgi:hypothetical protein
MPLFGRHHDQPAAAHSSGVPGLAEAAVRQGWQPVTGSPFEGGLVDRIHELTLAMFGASTTYQTGIGLTNFEDAFRGHISGRTVVVANAWTVIEPGLFQAGRGTPQVAVCAAELPTIIMPPFRVQSRRLHQVSSRRESLTGNPAFDERFQVVSVMGGPVPLLTPQVQQRMMARDDWAFLAEGYLLSCVSKGAFGSAGEVSQRIADVLDIVAVLPESLVPRHVDHSADGLVARIDRLESAEDAIAFLVQLTPAEREQLARSDTPLAGFADVQTPQQALARFQSLAPQPRLQLLAMFARVKDARAGPLIIAAC